MSAPTLKPPLVKICGVRELRHAEIAQEVGADFVGVNFAVQSRRRVAPAEARAIRKALGPRTEVLDASPDALAEARASAGRPLLVGVFAGQSPEEILDILSQVDLDLVQLSGGENPALVARIPRPVLRVLHVAGGEEPAAILREAERGPATVTLLDTKTDVAGGSGRSFDWRIAAAVGARRPIMLAGGLTPENVAQAVRTAHPWAVDVASGVETEGAKDAAKIRAFVAAAKAAGEDAS